jgi:hypothetical protein
MSIENEILQLKKYIHLLPATFRAFHAQPKIQDIDIKDAVFSSYSKKYNAMTYNLLPYKPISKLLTYAEATDRK